MRRIPLPVLVALFSLVWSSAFVVGKVALRGYEPFTLLSQRFLLVALVLLPLCIRRPSLRDPRVIKMGLLLGLLNNAVYIGLIFLALRRIRPEVVIVVTACTPFATMLIAVLTGTEALSARKMLGVAIGFVGVVVMSGVVTTSPPDLRGLLYSVLSMCAFAVSTVLFRRRSSELPALETNFWQGIAGGLVLLPVSLIFEHPVIFPNATATLAFLYLIVGPSIGGMSLWFMLIHRTGAGSASSYLLITPFVGILLSYIILGSPLHVTDFVGATLLAIGLIFATRSG